MATVILDRVALATGRRYFRSVVDIGAGTGEALDLARQEYGAVDLCAIESSQECQASLRLLGVKLLSDDVDSEWYIDYQGAFGLVLMRHVLEHLLDPVSVLKKVGNVLSADGVVYLAVPDMMSPGRPLQGYWFCNAHTYYFSTATLLYTMRLAGLEPLVHQRANSEIFCIAKRSEHSSCSLEPPSVYLQQLTIIKAFFAIDAVQSLGMVYRLLPRPVKSAVRRLLELLP